MRKQALGCAAILFAGSLTPAYAESQFSFRIVGHIPVQCEGHGEAVGIAIAVNQDCNVEHVVRVSADPDWAGVVHYRGRSVRVTKGQTAEFIFMSVEDGVWPLRFSRANVPESINIELTPL